MDFRICILIVTLSLLRFSEQCSVNFVPDKCRYNMICIDSFDYYEGWQRFLSNNHNEPNMEYEDPGAIDKCSALTSITNSGYNFDPIYLVFKQTKIYIDATAAVPRINNGDSTIIRNIIYSLDLSGNNYERSPAIQELENLAILNISNNNLTTAVLSNINQLNNLIEIDLSFNNIYYIQYRYNEHPYSTLKKINMSHNNLVYIPDAVFDKIDDLQNLDLSYNYIEGLSQYTFDGTRSLLHLNLSNNRISDINSSLFRFSKLKALSLGGNKIKKIKESDFEKLNRLELLDLSSNFIKIIDTNTLSNTFLLHSLDLANNLIGSVSKDMLVKLLSLNSIDISKNKLTSLPEGLFKNKTINAFSISENLLEGSLTRGMFEGIHVTALDLSNQLLTGIEDYAFNNQYSLNILLLNNNAIQSLSNMCFRTLIRLQQLDLSNNKVSSLDFSKIDLTNLHSLLLRNNRLEHIKSEHFHFLNSLEYLDLSENAISVLEANSFKSLRNLINLPVSGNPLNGTMETNTFDGLISLPSLDISRTLLTTVQNASFNDMNELKELNISRSKVNKLEYNAFAHTGNIVILDLSYNKLEILSLNMTELVRLSTLLLNNNLLKTLSPTLLDGLTSLNTISLAHNALEDLHNETFSSLIDLQFLDVSYNEKFNFRVKLLEKCKTLKTLILSGIKTKIFFDQIKDSTISDLFISDAGIHNITALNLNVLTQLSMLVLSHNNVSKLEIGALSGIGTLEKLDLSINNIFYIQPGAFKDNGLLYSLNISHNSLSSIDYGIFRGLIHLITLDMSYNNIKDLQNERFYEVKSLSELIVDHNKIDSVNAEEFMGTSLSKLSIGDNPLPCQVLVNLKKKDVPFEITAIILDEHSSENIDGITCNKDRGYETHTIVYKDNEKSDILVDVRNILYNMSNHKNTQEYHNDDKYLENMTNLIDKANTINKENLFNTAKSNNESTMLLKKINNDTNILLKKINSDSNILLQRILMSFANNSIITTTSVPLQVSKTFDPIENKNVALISYINNIKMEFEKAIADEKDKLEKLENKFSLIHYQTEFLSTSPSNVAKLVSTASNNEGTKSLFTETCVALILLILVGLVLYKFYKSRMFVRNRFSFSTRELPGAMENSTL